MYLKSLKLVGFKSFADRTRLEFRPGVTVVVGPNGAGKSNLVDAVAWAMGTQSTRALRTERMDDVIFAGSSTRPSLGRAEVTLVFDNASRLLPLDLPEVSITRRLYRDGTSDYDINGVGCRLLDLSELLSDSGVGRHQHVIVSQGQIESVLNASPDEHRQVIEEAAGILKHRLRKERAMRRLEQTEVDVHRLRDLVKEIARQMRPLRRQAEAAERHLRLAAEVRGLTLYLGGRQLRSIHERLVAARSEEEHERRLIHEAETEVRTTSHGIEKLEPLEKDALAELERDTGAAGRLETNLERLRRIAAVAAERHRAAQIRLEGTGERRHDLEIEALHQEAEVLQAAAAEEVARVSGESAEATLRAMEDEERVLAEQQALTGEGALTLLTTELRSLQAAQDRDHRETEAVARRIATLTEELADGRAEANRVNDEIRELDAAVPPAQRSYEAAQAGRAAAQAAWETAEVAHQEARLSSAFATAKVEALAAAVDHRPDPEARALVEASPAVLGSLRSRLDVPADLVASVDAALGPWSDALAVAGLDGLDELVSALKAAGRGGLPLVVVDGVGRPSEARSIAEKLGLGLLVDGLGPDADRKLAERLAGDVLLVEGWAMACQLVRRFPGLRAVTPEGDLVTADGVRLAAPETPAVLEAAATAEEAAGLELARAHSRLNSTRREFEAARETERRELDALEAIEARLAGATEALVRLQRLEAGIAQEAARLEQRGVALEQAESERRERMGDVEARRAALSGEEAQRRRQEEALAARRRDLVERREGARTAWQRATAEMGAASERRTLLEARLEAVRSQLAEQVEPAGDSRDLGRLVAVERWARTGAERVRTHLETLRARQLDLRDRVADLGTRLGEERRRLQVASEALALAKDRLAQVSVLLTELRLRAEGIVEGLQRDADASEEEALAAPPPSPDTDGDLDSLLASRRAELRRMGPVNPLAAEEYRALSERHHFLEAQLDDLERSRQELRRVLKAVDVEMEAQFLTAFEEVSSAYQAHFTLLFPGGRGRVRLTDPSQPLISGVDIEAQPLGKKVSRLSLLSGGERSLAALAFLFAVFKARPSPFYVLDEVEAALDDTNLRRFLRLIEAFRSEAQVIIVTHQQQTMEAADLLYGVTMEPGGSSQVVATSVVGSYR